MEWTTQGGEGQLPGSQGGLGNGHGVPAYGHDTQPLPSPPPFPEESATAPVASPPPPVPAHAAPVPGTAPQAPTGYERCPSCGALVAADQRYCLECGHRRGDPRLPFMDAVVFMEAMNRPAEPATAPARAKKRGISPNAALIAGVGTLLLALGVGVLIGRSGNHGATQAAAPAQVVTVSGGGGESSEASSSSGGGGEANGVATTKKKSKKQVVKQKTQEAESGQGAEEVLHTAPGVKMAPATQEIGAKCEKGVAGCSKSGKFDGSFFGEEEE